MKAKQSVTVAIALALSCVTLQAQNAFFPTQAGMTMLYTHQDAKGKAASHTRYTIRNVEGSGDNLTISYVMETLDKNMKPRTKSSSEIPCTVVIRDGVVYMDMNQTILEQVTVPDLKMEITGVPLELPGNLQPGQSIKDANMTLTVDAGILKMKTDMNMTDGQCQAIEDVTVKAGTFTCHKITQTITTSVLRKNVVTTTITWYAPGIGTVKTETYSDKNKLTGSVELLSINT